MFDELINEIRPGEETLSGIDGGHRLEDEDEYLRVADTVSIEEDAVEGKGGGGSAENKAAHDSGSECKGNGDGALQLLPIAELCFWSSGATGQLDGAVLGSGGGTGGGTEADAALFCTGVSVLDFEREFNSFEYDKLWADSSAAVFSNVFGDSFISADVDEFGGSGGGGGGGGFSAGGDGEAEAATKTFVRLFVGTGEDSSDGSTPEKKLGGTGLHRWGKDAERADLGDNVTTWAPTLFLDPPSSCNKAVIPRDEGALWYLESGEDKPWKELENDAGLDRELWGVPGELIWDCKEDWNSPESLFFRSEFVSIKDSDEAIGFTFSDLSRELMMSYSRALEVEASSAINFCFLALSGGTISIIPVLELWEELEFFLSLTVARAFSNFSCIMFDAVICNIFSATSAFGSSQSILLNISWTLANASIGMLSKFSFLAFWSETLSPVSSLALSIEPCSIIFIMVFLVELSSRFCFPAAWKPFKFSSTVFNAVFWFGAGSAFRSRQSTFLNFSWALANASIGRPPLSSITGKSSATTEEDEFISAKRSFID